MTDELIQELEAQAERSLQRLGELEPRVIGAVAPQVVDGQHIPWPWRVLGRVRIVRREHGVLYVTDGLSYPFDPSVHEPDKEPLGFELGIEIEVDEGVGVEALSRAWPVPALLWLAARYLADDFNLLDLIERFGMATQMLPPDPALRQLVLDDGSVGALAGMPLTRGAPFGRESQWLLADVEGFQSRLIVLTSITPDECAYARAVHDGSRSMDLAQALWVRGSAHRTIPTRTSLLRG